MGSSKSGGETKRRILSVVEWYPPAFKAGGPIRSVHNLVQLLQGHANVEVVTGAYDLGDEQPMKGITPNEWITQNNVPVLYQRKPTPWFWYRKLKGNAGEPRPDVIYLNSVFGFSFGLVPLLVSKVLGVKVLLAPRGMLGAGALSLKKRKKQLFFWLTNKLGLYNGITWHASTLQEKREIEAIFPNSRVKVALNIPHPSTSCASPEWNEAQHWLMLGRIQKKKNFHFALGALKNVKLEGRRVVIDLVGPAEDSDYLKSLLAFQKEEVQVVYHGAQPPQRLKKIWEKSHALLLPTKHENFGHVVLESWAHGRVVMLSDQTPWRKLTEQGLGWDLPLVEEEWTLAMQELVDLSEDLWKKRSERCVEKHHRVLTNPELIASNLALFD